MLEVLVSVALAGTLIVSLYAGFSGGFAVVQLARENLRGTQILQEKMETIRLYTWAQINTPGFIPETFTDFFYATSTNLEAAGMVYTGTVAIATAPFPTEDYAADLKTVTVRVNWTSGGIVRNREMTTYISRYGLQNYIY